MKNIARLSLIVALLFGRAADAQDIAISAVTQNQLNAAAAANLATMNGVINSKLGSTGNTGHTVTPVVINFATVALGGTITTVSGLVDPISGNVPGVGALCWVGNSTATPFTAQMTITCTITASGVASIRAVPVGIAALGAQSITGNIFWTW